MNRVLRAVERLIRSDGIIFGLYLLVSRISRRGISKIYSYILSAPGISVGPGCQISGIKFIRFGKGISIYRNLWLQAVTEYAGVKFNPIIELGDRVKFSNGVHITAINQIIIGNDVLFGSHVYISDHNHGGYSGDLHTPPTVPPADRVLHSNGKVVIEANVWIGDNVNIVGPVTIGYGAVIAANSVVRKDVPSNTIVAGAPARLLKMFNASNQEWERNL
jgi:lipopolysaccharide O-acetyltransferase